MLSRTGPHLHQSKSSKDSRASPTFIDVLSKSSSQLSSPLTFLLRNQPKSLSWTASATNAFETLKEAFISAPVPDPELSFVIEVDASTTGVGAVLYQWQGDSQCLHPCAFYSKKLSSAEQNYDIGNRELLAIKLALEKWRYWVEGATHQFEVITNHRILEYLREANHLNTRQARRALFFTRFNFIVTYCCGHKNVKADVFHDYISLILNLNHLRPSSLQPW